MTVKDLKQALEGVDECLPVIIASTEECFDIQNVGTNGSVEFVIEVSEQCT